MTEKWCDKMSEQCNIKITHTEKSLQGEQRKYEKDGKGGNMQVC